MLLEVVTHFVKFRKKNKNLEFLYKHVYFLLIFSECMPKDHPDFNKFVQKFQKFLIMIKPKFFFTRSKIIDPQANISNKKRLNVFYLKSFESELSETQNYWYSLFRGSQKFPAAGTK